jgi:translation initiation factor 3 subunit I
MVVLKILFFNRKILFFNLLFYILFQ